MSYFVENLIVWTLLKDSNPVPDHSYFNKFRIHIIEISGSV